MKKTLIVSIALVMVCALHTLIFADGTIPIGSGTALDPYQVATLDNLLWISTNDTQWDKYYIQTTDIDASDTQNWNGGEGWSPIGEGGYFYTKFTGSYDGQGYTISNMYINRDETAFQGLFGYTQGATIENLGVVDCSITYLEYCGDWLGGLIGCMEDGTVSGCYVTGTVTGDSEVGGLIGCQEGGTVTNSYATGLVSGSSAVGGLVGHLWNGTVTECYATGSVTAGSETAGGLIGLQRGESSVIDCYARGAVTGDSRVGGLIGLQICESDDVSVTNCYSTGLVTGSGGGLIGFQVPSSGNYTVTSCFWDTETSGQSTSAAGTGRTTAEMKTQGTFTDWDFTDTWSIDAAYNDSYPYLQHNNPYVGIIGDFNGDGYVDVQDSQLFGDHWLFEEGDPGWDAMYDLIVDGIIDVLDSQVFGDHWHEGTPPTLIKEDGIKGPNENAGIVFDLDPTYGNQNLTHIASQPAGTIIKVGVYCTGVHNLDTYSFDVVYNSDELTYITAAAMSSVYEPNILTTEGGTAVNWMVSTSSGRVGVSYTLTGQDTTQAPEGEGLLGEIVFRAQVPTYGILSFENVKYLDTFGQLDNITNTGTATLPLELSAFTATYNTTNGYTSLEWTTASETDIIGFNVYRSTEDEFDTSKKLNFDVIDGHGTTTEINTYAFIDDSQLDLGTVYYYWLESVELGGINTVYSSIDITPSEGSGGYINDFDSNSLSNFPNPVKGSTTISYAVKGMLQSQPIEINIYNMLGQLVDTVEGRDGEATWNTSDHVNGVYFYKLSTDSYTEIKKMMLVK